MNRLEKKIDWKFDRKAARLKLSYAQNSIKRSKTYPWHPPLEIMDSGFVHLLAIQNVVYY